MLPIVGRDASNDSRVPGLPLICIIDDDESMRTTLCRLIRSLGYDARNFASAEDFLQCAQVKDFACIITDIQMPGMSGIELKEHLSASECTLPVIMITARHEPGLEEKALSSGAAYFLRKPFKADVLIDCLQNALRA